MKRAPKIAIAAMMAGPPIVCIRGVETLDWLPEEAAAWAMAELVPTAEWVEKHVRIPTDAAALPGPVDLNLTPYLRGPFEAIDDPEIETITFMSGSQLGKTLFLYGSILAGVVQRPGPRLLVMPTEPDAREVAGGPLKNMAVECEAFISCAAAGEASLTKEGWQIIGGNVHFGWSNSAASLARRPCREVFYDEVDKFPPYIGRDVDPISLGDKRLRTYRNTTGSKSVRVSTPTTPDGPIAESYDESDKRTFRVPCPACGAHQRLMWDRVVWPRGPDGHSADPDKIERGRLARYACEHCEATWTDGQKNTAVRSGVWARDGEEVTAEGRVTGQAIKTGRHAGFAISAIYSPFTTLGQLAAAFLRAVARGAIALQDFVNSELGEIWLEKETETSESAMRKHAGGYDKAKADAETGLVVGQMPPGVQAITASVDVQKHEFIVCVRGWGFGLESWVLDYRRIPLDEIALGRYLRTTRFLRIGHDSEVGMIGATVIDTGDQAAYVYGILDRWRDIVIYGVRTASADGGPPWTSSPREKDPRTGRRYSSSIPHYTKHPQFYKDRVALRMHHDEPGPGYIHLPADVDDDYLGELCSEHKVFDRRRGKTGRSARRPKKSWVIKPGHGANHYWDTAVNQELVADLLHLRFLPDPAAKPQGAKEKPKTAGDGWQPSRWEGFV